LVVLPQFIHAVDAPQADQRGNGVQPAPDVSESEEVKAVQPEGPTQQGGPCGKRLGFVAGGGCDGSHGWVVYTKAWSQTIIRGFVA